MEKVTKRISFAPAIKILLKTGFLKVRENNSTAEARPPKPRGGGSNPSSPANLYPGDTMARDLGRAHVVPDPWHVLAAKAGNPLYTQSQGAGLGWSGFVGPMYHRMMQCEFDAQTEMDIVRSTLGSLNSKTEQERLQSEYKKWKKEQEEKAPVAQE